MRGCAGAVHACMHVMVGPAAIKSAFYCAFLSSRGDKASLLHLFARGNDGRPRASCCCRRALRLRACVRQAGCSARHRLGVRLRLGIRLLLASGL